MKPLLTRPLADDSRLEKVERYEHESQFDSSMKAWLREAYDRGCQKQLTASHPAEHAVRRKSGLA